MEHQIPGELRSRLIGNKPKANGEWDMRCPLIGHDDAHRSASLNVKKGQWYCFACAKGGSIDNLVTKNVAEFENIDEVYDEFSGLPSESNVARYHKNLMQDKARIKAFQRDRGISVASLKRFKIGWNPKALKGEGAFTIPVYDSRRKLVNIRSYNKNNEPKIWSIYGHGAPRLFPLEVLDAPGPITIVEGEWDAILTIQQGFNAVTRTGAADVWKTAWNSLFQDRKVYLCHDADAKGQAANQTVESNLESFAESVHVIHLPYPIVPKHGKDLTDYFHVDKRTAEDFKALQDDAEPFGRTASIERVSISKSLDGQEYWGRKLVVPGRVRGKSQTQRAIPSNIRYYCDHSMGDMCEGCDMNDKESIEVTIPKEDPAIVDFLEMGERRQEMFLRSGNGVLRIPSKCVAIKRQELANYAVTDLDIRPAFKLTDLTDDAVEVDASRRILVLQTIVSIKTNEVVDFTGHMHRTGTGENIFVAYQAERSKDDIEAFETTDEMIEHCKELQCKPEDSLAMVMQIGQDLSNYTGIVERSEVHAMMDLVWHSAVTFKYEGRYLPRGWLECLLLGETRTGKSEIALQMLHLYDLGEFVSCESTTPAGITGGLVQRPNAGWSVQLGAFPFNDRGLVILDEVSGLGQDQISQLTEMRSSGILKITKIENERAPARVRSIWLSNPRGEGYVSGVQGIMELIGKPEDVSRFDMAYSIQTDGMEDVSSIVRSTIPMPMFSKDSYRALVRWAWTRKPDQIKITPEAEDESRKQASAMARRYTAKPPLVISGDARVKIMRVAVAIAQRTFSTNTGNDVIVTSHHVRAAVDFMDMLYQAPGFGYYESSQLQIAEINKVRDQEAAIHQEVARYPSLHGYLFRNGAAGFRAQDLRESLGVNFDEANSLVNRLEGYGMLERDGQKTKLTNAGIRFMRGS